MRYKIAIASGKGGTGKTTVAVNLFHLISEALGERVQLVDCDVEEPNDILFFENATKLKEIDIDQLIPEIDQEKCIYCRKCVEYCEFNAIVVIPPMRFAEVNSSLCHSCGACSVACTENAINEKQESIGKVAFYNTDIGNGLVEGKLKIGSAMQTMLIGELKQHVPVENDIVIFDSPPGTSCPVVETVSDADYIVLVAEPTPFGLHDLKLMVELLRKIEKPFGVVINKAGLGSDDIYAYLNDEAIELLGEIPFSEVYAANYAKGELMGQIPAEIKESYLHLLGKLERKILVHEGNNYFKW